MAPPTSITLRQPDDWHAHLRDGPMLQACAVHTASQFARAIIMPNLVPPVTTVAEAKSYRERIRSAVPAGLAFEPLMTCYLTDGADPAELARGVDRAGLQHGPVAQMDVPVVGSAESDRGRRGHARFYACSRAASNVDCGNE